MNITKVIYLHGAPAVGKLTTAKKLCEKTGYKLLHNHLTTDLVRAVFERGNPKGDMYIVKLRFEMLELALHENVAGVVMTGAHAVNYRYPNGESDDWYAQKLESITENNGGEFYGVHLTASNDELLNRVSNEDRASWGKITDPDMLVDSLKINDFTKPARVKNIVSLNNSNKSVGEIADEIVKIVF
jgi:shikimate kinase